MGLRGVVVAMLVAGSASAGAQGHGPARGRLDRVVPTVRFGEGTAEGIDRNVARRIVRRHAAQIRYCYEKTLHVKPGLRGRILLTITVDKDGKVSDATTTGIEPAVDECLGKRARTWAFPTLTGDRATYSAWLAFSPDGTLSPVDPATGHAPVADLPTPVYPVDVVYQAPAITGALDREKALAVVKQDVRAHQHCFVAVDATTPGGLKNATVTVAIDVDGGGAITSTTVTDAPAELAACLHRRVQTRAFPPPKDRQPAGFSIQVAFKKKPAKK